MPRQITDEELIRVYAEQGRGYTDTELGEYFEVGREAIYKRRQRLEKRDYYFYETERGRYRLDNERSVSHITVNESEALVLYLATRRFGRHTPIAQKYVRDALKKLAPTLHKPMMAKLAEAATNAPIHPDDKKREQILSELMTAWTEKRVVRLTYLPLGAQEATNHEISPYLIEPSPWSDSIYIVGHSATNDKIIPFSLERIEKATLTLSSARFVECDEKTEAQLLKNAWGIWFSDREPQPVELHFRGRRTVRRLGESIWHPDEAVEVNDEGDQAIWRANIAEPREMLPWIRGWGADVEVRKPNRLRRDLEREARRLAKMYGVTNDYTSPERFFAHTKPDWDESEWQLLIDHLKSTAELASELGADAGVSELAKTAGLLHDIGKYSKEFQARLRGSNRRVDHATAGAREIVKLFPNNPFAEILSYCIAGHHTGLPDYGSKADMAEESTLLARREKKVLKNYDAYKTEIDTKSLTLPTHRLKPVCFRLGEREKQYTGFSISFLTRMVFSALVDADWLDTERYMQDEVKPRGQHADIAMLAEHYNRFLKQFDNPQNDLNRKRTETLKYVLAQADRKPSFFTLTVPTGGGKTHTSMAFALNHALKHGLRRIIYVIPFTGIIEQNAKVFRDALGDLGLNNILEHHSNFDWDGKQKNSDDESNSTTAKLKLAAENWDIPIVVTTNVQFFESLFSNKKRSARKLHNIAKSVIIFDEVQVLPRDYLKPSLLAVQELVQNYGASAVFCTATQPALEQFFPAETQFTELAPNPQELFDFYRRVRVENLATQTDEEIIAALQAHRQALCIVNTRKHAKGLFAQLDGENNFHLSTLMCPAHRTEKMQEIRQRLADTQPCRVVSTQVMEAGIDIDFPVGYRAIAGLDSIIQASGRVNRERGQDFGAMYVFTPKTKFIKRTPGFIAQTGAVADGTMAKFADDPISIPAIEAYYQQLYALQGEDSYDAKKILKCFDKGTGQVVFDFKTAAENFNFIEDNTVSVIIPYDDEAIRLIETLKYTAFPMSVLRKLQTYTVNIYEREFMDLQSKGVILTIDEQYHFLDESQMGEEKYYHPQTGLMLPESGGGDAIFFD